MLGSASRQLGGPMRALSISAAVVVLVACVPPAAASPNITAAVNAGYSRAESGGVSADGFGGGGQALITLNNPGFGLQFSGAGSSTSGGGASSNSWVASFDGFFRDSKGSMGFSVAHGSVGAGFFDVNVTGYGVFGEWYATRHLTLRFNAGGFSGDESGWYGSAGAEYYVAQNLGVFAEYNYVRPSSGSFFKMHVASVGAEYLISRGFPLSIRAEYDYTHFVGANSNGFAVALHYRINLDGSLVAMDRTGPTNWNGLPRIMRVW